MALDTVNHLMYVASKATDSVQVYDSVSGAYIRTLAVGNATLQVPTDPAAPIGLAVDAAGNVYVASSADNVVLRYTSTGALVLGRARRGRSTPRGAA